MVLPNLNWTNEFYQNKKVRPTNTWEGIDKVCPPEIAICPDERVLSKPYRREVVLHNKLIVNKLLDYGAFDRNYMKDVEGLKPQIKTKPYEIYIKNDKGFYPLSFESF